MATALSARHRPTPRAHRHLQRQPIAGHDGQAELGVVHAAQPRAGDRRRRRRVHEQDGRHLRQRLDHEHAGHQRRAGKMPLEEIFVDGDVLDGLDPPPRLVLGDGVNQRRGIAVAEPVERGLDVDSGHGE